jgi:hypothetical protein
MWRTVTTLGADALTRHEAVRVTAYYLALPSNLDPAFWGVCTISRQPSSDL